MPDQNSDGAEKSTNNALSNCKTLNSSISMTKTEK